MDKAKTNLVIGIVVLVIACIALIGYASNVNSQLTIERSRISGLNVQIVDLQRQLSEANSKVDGQKALVNSLQSSLTALNAETDNLKAVNIDLEAKLNAAQAQLTASQPQATEPTPAVQ